jgi:DNA-directed RNA polymerase subunit N (RpoN/RPB10)
MGRYYNGDIEGKFWFAVQSSDDAEQFGARESTNYINYYADNIQEVKKRLYEIFDELGIDEPTFYNMNTVEGEDKFYEDYKEYAATRKDNDDKLWASLELGLKMYWCILESGSCSFEAEL